MDHKYKNINQLLGLNNQCSKSKQYVYMVGFQNPSLLQSYVIDDAE